MPLYGKTGFKFLQKTLPPSLSSSKTFSFAEKKLLVLFYIHMDLRKEMEKPSSFIEVHGVLPAGSSFCLTNRCYPKKKKPFVQIGFLAKNLKSKVNTAPQKG